MAEKKVVSEKIYVFCGDGLGIPGLPHELTIPAAQALGVLGLLQACIERGTYIDKNEVKHG